MASQDPADQENHERAVVAFKQTWDDLVAQGLPDETCRQALLSLSIVALVANMGEQNAASVAEGLAQKIRDGAFTPQPTRQPSSEAELEQEILDKLAGGPDNDDDGLR